MFFFFQSTMKIFTQMKKTTTKGTYVFITRLNTAKDIRYNVKGDVHRFQRGWYAYIGSAFNSGGLKTRLNRHLMASVKRGEKIVKEKKAQTMQ